MFFFSFWSNKYSSNEWSKNWSIEWKSKYNLEHFYIFLTTPRIVLIAKISNLLIEIVIERLKFKLGHYIRSIFGNFGRPKSTELFQFTECASVKWPKILRYLNIYTSFVLLETRFLGLQYRLKNLFIWTWETWDNSIWNLSILIADFAKM